MDSEQGTIEAIGWEKLEYKNLGLGAPTAGVLGSITMIVVLLLSSSMIGPEEIGYGFLGALFIFLASIVFLLRYRITTYNPKNFVVHYSRGGQGENLLSVIYKNQRNKNRTNVLVERVVSRPGIPLRTPMGQFLIGVPGTQSSLLIHLQGRLALELGFPNEESMMRAYDRIKTYKEN